MALNQSIHQGAFSDLWCISRPASDLGIVCGENEFGTGFKPKIGNVVMDGAIQMNTLSAPI